MILSTTFDVPGRTIAQNLGVARGNVVRSRFIGRDIVAGFRMIVGGEIRVTVGVRLLRPGTRTVSALIGSHAAVALGVQEGGFILVCGLFGISPQTAIELSLLKRIREVALGIPALIALHAIETRRLYQWLLEPLYVIGRR